MIAALLFRAEEALLPEKGLAEPSLLTATAGRAAGSCLQPPPKGCLWPVASLRLLQCRLSSQQGVICHKQVSLSLPSSVLLPLSLRGTDCRASQPPLSPLCLPGVVAFSPARSSSVYFSLSCQDELFPVLCLKTFALPAQLRLSSVLSPSDTKEQDTWGMNPRRY